MIGPVVKIDPASLPKRANIHWLGGKPYAALPDYLAGWDVGLMPFAMNESTRFISPTKTPEFLAAGLPVVSTAIRDVVRPYGEKHMVAIASDAEGFVREAERLLAADRAGLFAKVDRYLAQLSWDKTWAQMDQHIRRVMSPNTRFVTHAESPLVERHNA
jgi:glycosyltransferase involved in cell wall biosynthesis